MKGGLNLVILLLNQLSFVSSWQTYIVADVIIYMAAANSIFKEYLKSSWINYSIDESLVGEGWACEHFQL